MLVRIPVPTLIRRMEMEVVVGAVPHIRSEMEASRPMESARRLIVLTMEAVRPPIALMIGSLLELPMRAVVSPTQLKCRGMSTENRS